MSRIAIVGMACCYPDARSPRELWENALAQRSAFRRIPPQRLRLEDYYSDDRQAADCTYAREAAVIEGYEFDRVRYGIAGSTYRATDLAHWLALDVAAQALADAGFTNAEGLPKDRTAVLVGNTLTGEFSRAETLRLRWPYVRRVVSTALREEGWAAERRLSFLSRLEAQFKAPFAPVGEETLAGGLSNTIAGRICNYFDLKGGGYTVDGACAASLLAVTTACIALEGGDVDVALAGGVDLSLDPFELIGFAKAGALADGEMRVYDAKSTGFWPGEGCGFVVLMRYEDVLARNQHVYAVIKGWGVSSDGSGGITRPEVEGQLLALRRAYRRAGYGPVTVAYFEGHGTGTSVGDATELQALAKARREAGPILSPAAVGSIKANIGHTKAAAGVAGLIKATMAIHSQILPPTSGCETPRPELAMGDGTLDILRQGIAWPTDRPLRAGISAMGFGGINTHVTIEGESNARRNGLSVQERALLSSSQGAELFLLGTGSSEDLVRNVEQIQNIAAQLSRAELVDLAGSLQKMLDDPCTIRAAVVASTPDELATRLQTLRRWIADGQTDHIDAQAGVFLGAGTRRPTVTFLFPGQGSPTRLDGGAFGRRFEWVQDLYAGLTWPATSSKTATVLTQPAIAMASLAALMTLERLGMTASIGVGHSLGELVALHWAGALDAEALLRISTARGRAMMDLVDPAGAMASLDVGPADIEPLLAGQPVVIACVNTPHQTVISGEAPAVAAVVARARQQGWAATRLPVSHAFHSPLMAPAVPQLAAKLAREMFRPLRRTVVSTVTGTRLAEDADLSALLCRQVTSPVCFVEALEAVGDVDLLVEVGPGDVLTGLADGVVGCPAISTDACASSLASLLRTLGAAFALGVPIRHDALFAGRFFRPFNLQWRPRFFANPCELAPLPDRELLSCPGTVDSAAPGVAETSETFEAPAGPTTQLGPGDAISLLQQLVAQRAELPIAAVRPDSRLLDDLHLNSIAVGQVVAKAAKLLGSAPPTALNHYAKATVAEIAQALEELVSAVGTRSDLGAGEPAGVGPWVRAFVTELVQRPLKRRHAARGQGTWRVITPPGHPLADSLQQALARSREGHGVVLCTPRDPHAIHASLLVEATRAILGHRTETTFVMVQQGGGAAALARTLHLEVPDLTTCVVDLPFDHPAAAEWIVAEALAAVGYSEAHYDQAGVRREPLLRLLPLDEAPGEPGLSSSDVLVVTGGGKGIAAECAIALACKTGVRLILLGRSDPAQDTALARNLERMRSLGLVVQYLEADVTDAGMVRAAIREAEVTVGPVTAILHGAGINNPRPIGSLDEAAFLETIAPKVQGARNLLGAINRDHLKLFVAFGSIIARTGLPGEADYGVANEWLARLTERLQEQCPHCRCLALEWSLWAGVGMGERLGRVEALMREGIVPLTIDQGVEILQRLIAKPSPAVTIVVAGRFGTPPTVQMDSADLPLVRFLERPRVHYPGIELVCEALLSADTDPYLDDHVLSRDRILPAVIGLEAIAQAAMAVVGSLKPPVFEAVKFKRSITIADGAPTVIRVAALAHTSQRVDVVVRSSETDYQVDHYQASCRFDRPASSASALGTFSSDGGDAADGVAIDPHQDLYGGILFHRGRFRRLKGYRRLTATECVAEIAPAQNDRWFSPYLPAELVLGDPGARDASVHSVQACIPHLRLLPVGVDLMMPHPEPWGGSAFVVARERTVSDGVFVYDLEIQDIHGAVRERWEGLRMAATERLVPQSAWSGALLGPYLERRLQELAPVAPIRIAVTQHNGADRQLRGDRAIQTALGSSFRMLRRPDGKPELDGDWKVSMAHAGDITFAVAGRSRVACDVERIVYQDPSTWQDLLGQQGFGLARWIAQETHIPEDDAATRVWCAHECLAKVGIPFNSPLSLGSCTEDEWVLLTAGSAVIATVACRVRQEVDRLAFAILAGSVQ